MKKKAKATTRGKKKTDRAVRARSAHRITTHRANGSMSESVAVPAEASPAIPIADAMKEAVEALGPVTINKQLAPNQLRQLSDAYEDVTRRKAVYAAKADEAKTAKKSMDSAIEMLLELVRTCTHATPLPLFDETEREADQADMLAGGQVDATAEGDEVPF